MPQRLTTNALFYANVDPLFLALRLQAAGCRPLAAGTRDQAAGCRDQGPGTRPLAAGTRDQAARLPARWLPGSQAPRLRGSPAPRRRGGIRGPCHTLRLNVGRV